MEIRVAVRPWFIAGVLHLVAAALLGVVAASPSVLVEPALHVVVAAGGVFLLLGGLAYGFVEPFLKREILSPWPARLAFALVLTGDALCLWAPFVGVGETRALGAAYGVAFLLLPLDVLLAAAVGRPWREGLALFAKDQPYRGGDALAAAAFGVGLLGLVAGGVLLVVPPRGTLAPALAMLLAGFALPFAAGAALFLLPRNARRPMPGMTLVVAALGLGGLGAAALTVAFARPVAADFRFAGAALAAAYALFGIAILRLRYEAPGVQLLRARPFLRGGAVLVGLGHVVLVLAVLSAPPALPLLMVALVSHLLGAAALALGLALLGAPILLNAVPRDGSWAKWSASLLILGAFLVAPSFQYARSAFPGALVIAFAVGLAAWGLWPMRRPRREC